MGWNGSHVHKWTIWTSVKMPVEALGEDENGDEFVAEVPFCAWICECGAWRWRVSPEVYTGDFMEI